MNCLDFHREKLADPRRQSQPALAHEHECASCAAFARSVDENERALERALAAPVPEGLAERALLRARTGRRFVWRRRALAAAGILVAVPLGFALIRGPAQPPDQYARLAIEHVTLEPESLTTLRNADPEALRAVLQNFGGRLKAPLGQVRYIRLCPVEEGFGWHIVFDTPEGLATLILVPGRQLDATQTLSAGGWSALARPTQRGYYAVVTASAAATSRVDELLRARVDWNT
jgi:hypothetical protein